MKFPESEVSKKRPEAPARRGRVAQIIGVLLLAGVLQACSAVKLAYNQATTLAYWRLNGYFDFTQEQARQVRQELARVHQWHRQTQLPAYAQTMRQWQAWLPGELNETQACAMLDEVRGMLQAISDQSLPAVGALVGTLGPDQLAALERKFVQVNAEYRSDFLEGSSERLVQRRIDKAADNAEKLYGPLGDAQRAVLGRSIRQSVFDAQVSLAEYQRRQRDALQSLAPLIAGQATAEEARPVMQAYFARALNSPDPAYRSYQDRLQRDTCTTFAALHNSTTPAQRAQAVQTLTDYQQDFQLLAAQR